MTRTLTVGEATEIETEEREKAEEKEEKEESTVGIFHPTTKVELPRVPVIAEGETEALDVRRRTDDIDVEREPTTLDVKREPTTIRRRPERTRELVCAACGYAGETDERWIAHDPDEPMWVYECPECGEYHHVGPAPWTPPPIDG